MKEPIRWKDDPQAPLGARDLLEHAKPTAPMPPEAHALVAEKLLASTAATAPAAAASVVGVSAPVAAVVVAVAAVGGVVWTSRTPAPPPPAVRAPPSAESARPSEPTLAPVAAPVEGQSVEPSPTPEAASAPESEDRPVPPRVKRPRKRKPRPTPEVKGGVAPAGPRQDLVAEAALLEGARREAGRDPRRALKALDQHLRRYPEGALAAEREVLAIEVLGRLGRNEAQRRRAERFLVRFAHSPYIDRVRRALEE